jgi:predicted nucleic acid-binding protein
VESNKHYRFYTSHLALVEVMRTITRINSELISEAKKLLSNINFVQLSPLILRHAAEFPSEVTLRSSDAIHVATAHMILGNDGVLLTLDKQMALNAEKLGLKVISS